MVREAAVEFRKKHNALDWSVSVDDMIGLQGYVQDKYKPLSFSNFGEWLASAVNRAAKRVKALVSVKEKVILVATDLHERRVPFAKAHEMGHVVLPWHRDILYVCDEHDLSPSTQAQLEFEANTFASELLLPKELLDPIYSQFPSSLQTVMIVQELSGASIEASAIAYVKHHPGVCALLTLEEIAEVEGAPVDENAPRLRLVRKKLSQAAVNSPLATLARDQTFTSRHVLFTASRSMGTVETTRIRLGDQVYSATVANNTYKIFCLMTE